MPVKISEKKLLAAIICLAAGLVIFFKTSIIKMPIRLPEKDILLTVGALCLVAFSFTLLKRAVHKL